MHYEDKTKEIRDLLLKTVGKNPDLFCYYTAILEARSLISTNENIYPKRQNICENKFIFKRLIDC